MTGDALQGDLLLVPTELERSRFAAQPAFRANAQIEICGFGPIAAAAQTAQLLARYRPRRAILMGIAGTYDTIVVPIGSASTFNTVGLYGVGAGSGSEFLTPSQMGFPQWDGGETRDAVHEEISLDFTLKSHPKRLLTCCAASRNAVEVEQRLECFPQAIAEDMEGFGVALACAMADTPLRIVRGISNQAGDGDVENWKIDEAIQSAWELMVELLKHD